MSTTEPRHPRLGAAVRTDLRRAGVLDVLTDTTSRAAHSTDASLYRVPPLVVVRPRSAEEAAATLEVCRRRGVAAHLTGRWDLGGG